MSRLYASIDSDARKTQATSRGHKEISTHTRAWDVGVRVDAEVREDYDAEMFSIYATSGSNGGGSDSLIGYVALKDGEPLFIPANV